MVLLALTPTNGDKATQVMIEVFNLDTQIRESEKNIQIKNLNKRSNITDQKSVEKLIAQTK